MPRGLEGVVVAETAIGDVRGLEGFYHYRQYNAVELAEKRSLEDVWYLLFEGALPTRPSATRSRARSRRSARSRPRCKDVLPDVARAARNAPPLDLLRTTVSLMGAALGFQPSLDIDRAGAARAGAAGVRGGSDAPHRARTGSNRVGRSSTPTRHSRTRRTTST